ncbi:ATP-dependent zinc protease [Entomomonas moraniae]|uniref:ATP-dependent zinc protease n=1 Tax=Entomomonas moraniae TaxID=2213226 RepID=A0A3S9XC11_9GAMM|nr:ATP-dependent zinc protease [Entomomonas moraniae]AZS49935.1 ATP-dependent zinc protease [Entomomonas moraniae]
MLLQIQKVLCLSFLVSFAMVGFAEEKTVYGRYEMMKVEGLNGLVPAKLDTGAMTASLSATDIKVFKKDGEEWVRFTPQVKGKTFGPLEYPLAKMGKIKRRAADLVKVDQDDDADEEDPNYTYRPEIQMEVCLGNQLRTIDVNLTDRRSFSYPLLIGTKALRSFNAIVDPSLKYQSKATCGK